MFYPSSAHLFQCHERDLIDPLQKVVWCPGAFVPVFISRCWIELREFDMVVDCFFIDVFNFIINLHYSSLVTTSVAVIGSREDSHYRSIVLPLITLHNKLVSTCNKVKIVDMGELFCDILAEGVTSSSW
mmetsp:Transcript_20281/g.29001  ORF Transcript_20281/g.29001 Transcript_20281/m.29001 type:complete len:129 (-) Transcript_20281:738-1124(-)